MACQTKAGTAQFVNYLEKRYEVKITQEDWHAVRTLAEVEKGSTLRRSKLTPSETERLIRNLSIGDDSESIASLQKALEKERPTEGTARALYYLHNYGVADTLERIRNGRKSVGKTGSYGVKVLVSENGTAREYVFNVNSAEDAGNLVKSVTGLVSYEVAETQDDGSMKVMDPTDAMRFVEHGWANYKDLHAVIPDRVSYAVQVRVRDGNHGELALNYQARTPADVQKIVDEAGGGLVELTVAEERTGHTLANPDQTKTEYVTLSDEAVKDLLENID
jgi:hypothetical protein